VVDGSAIRAGNNNNNNNNNLMKKCLSKMVRVVCSMMKFMVNIVVPVISYCH